MVISDLPGAAGHGRDRWRVSRSRVQIAKVIRINTDTERCQIRRISEWPPSEWP